MLLEVDIRDFFGSINHEWMMKLLDLRIGDERVLSLIKSWLKAGLMEDRKLLAGKENETPQGGSISPSLANIYLHYFLDLWFVKKIAPTLKRKAALVRYADDFILLFQDENDLKEVHAVLGLRLSKCGLEIAENKTHVTRNKTGCKVVFRTDAKRFTRAKAGIKEKMWNQMHKKPKEQVIAINAVLRIHYNYNYNGIAGNNGRL